MGNKHRLFVDMDGTLAEFKQVDRLETLYEEGYFYRLRPVKSVLEAVREITQEHSDKVEVFIMSSYLSDSKYALQEKNEWLDLYLPEVPKENRIFPVCGEDKKRYVPGGIKSTDYLLDDYTKNLVLWQPPARGIKILNGINHTNGTWGYDRIRYDKAPKDLANDIMLILDGKPIMDQRPARNDKVDFSESGAGTMEIDPREILSHDKENNKEVIYR